MSNLEREENQPAHEVSERGFVHMEEVVSSYGAKVRVYESSAAFVPHIWLSVEDKPLEALPDARMAHLTLEQAAQVRDQLSWLIANHYHQSDPAPAEQTADALASSNREVEELRQQVEDFQFALSLAPGTTVEIPAANGMEITVTTWSNGRRARCVLLKSPGGYLGASYPMDDEDDGIETIARRVRGLHAVAANEPTDEKITVWINDENGNGQPHPYLRERTQESA